jgi:uncharacterized protein YqgV (UPF0045/DUF77 family)
LRDTEMQVDEERSGVSMITAQVSLYPLRQKSLGPTIREAVRVLHQHGLETRIGEMSTLVWGEEQALFAALRDAFHQAAERGDTVMAVTLSNACPSPEEP